MKPRSGKDLHGMIISDTSIRQPVFITMLMLLTIVIGLLAYTTLPVNLLPDISIPVVSVTVPYVCRPRERGRAGCQTDREHAEYDQWRQAHHVERQRGHRADRRRVRHERGCHEGRAG